MLLKFSVENYKSIRGKMTLSFDAKHDPEHPSHFFELGQLRFLKSAIIYGGNASGKTNLFQALNTAIRFVRMSSSLQLGESMPEIEPFLLDDSSYEEPVSFGFEFIAEGKKYGYSFSIFRNIIESEALAVYYTVKPGVIFRRGIRNQKEFSISQQYRKDLSVVAKHTAADKLFLSTAAAWNCETVRAPFEWFRDSIKVLEPDNEEVIRESVRMFAQDTNQRMPRFTCDLLKQAGIQISGYHISGGDYSKKQGNVESIQIIQKVKVNGKEVEKEYPLSVESQGMKKLFILSAVLAKTLRNGETLFIDDMDIHLSPHVLEYIVDLFHDPSTNCFNAQLVASCHCLSLFTMKKMRRDQLYVMAKSPDYGSSELHSLFDFSARKEMDARKAYMQWKFIPEFQGEQGFRVFIEPRNTRRT